MCDNRHWSIQEGRLLLQEWIRKSLEEATLTIDCQVSALRIQSDFNIFAFEPFANQEGLAKQMHMAMLGDLAKEGNSASGHG